MKMKKILALLLASSMCLSLVACGGNQKSNNADTGSNNEVANS